MPILLHSNASDFPKFLNEIIIENYVIIFDIIQVSLMRVVNKNRFSPKNLIACDKFHLKTITYTWFRQIVSLFLPSSFHAMFTSCKNEIRVERVDSSLNVNAFPHIVCIESN